MKKINFALITLLFVLSITLIGCSSGDKESANTPNEDTNEEKDDNTKYGGDLHFAFNAQPPNLDPPTNTSLDTRDIGHHIFEPLLTLNTKFEVQPMLAEDYEVSDDGKEITFHLRQGIKFHNGKEVTSEDVVASMERWQELSSQAQTYLNGTTSEAVDEHTIVAHIPNPTTLDLYIIADLTQFPAIMPKEIVEKAGKEWVEEYVGTGPYKLEEWKQDQYIKLTRYEDFQSRTEPADGLAGEKKAYVDNVYFHVVQDLSTRVSGLQTGEYHVAKNITQDSAELIEADDNLKNELYTTGFPIILFNKKEGVFTDNLVRKAANAAVNVEDILIATYGNEKYYQKNHSLVKEEQTNWYTEAGKDEYELYDLELAKELLEQSSYNGEEITILTTRDIMEWYNMMVVVQQQLEQIGMNVKLDVSDSATISERLDDPSGWDLYSTSFAFRPMPIMYHFLNPEWYGWIDSEEIDELKDKILHAATQEEAEGYKDQLHEAVWDYLPAIKTGDQTTIVSMKKEIDGYQHVAGPIIWNVSLNE